MTVKYKNNKKVAFADVNLSEEGIRGNHNPGAGGWPTVRYFNKETGYEGASYVKKTSKAMCDELGDEKYMEELIQEAGGVFSCSVEDGEGCSAKELKYIAKAKAMTEKQVTAQIVRLEPLSKKKMKPSLVAWMKQRLGILQQFKEQVAPDHEEL